jgi:hypothetical protein
MAKRVRCVYSDRNLHFAVRHFMRSLVEPYKLTDWIKAEVALARRLALEA